MILLILLDFLHCVGDFIYVFVMLGLLLLVKFCQAEEVCLKLLIFSINDIDLVLQALNFLLVYLVQFSNFFKLVQLIFDLLGFQSGLPQ